MDGFYVIGVILSISGLKLEPAAEQGSGAERGTRFNFLASAAISRRISQLRR